MQCVADLFLCQPMNNYNRWNQDFFNFQKRARIATLSVIGIGMLCMVILKLWNNYVHPVEEMTLLLTEVERKEQQSLEEEIKSKPKYVSPKRWKVKVPKEKFNPNTYKKEDWMNLGYSEKQAQAVMNFKASGFVFRVKKDVLKLFIVDEESYLRLENYIDLPDSLPPKSLTQTSKVNEEVEDLLGLSLNEVTTDELTAIKGVGPYYAAKVLKFRDALGGFVNEEQLYEVYHLPDSVALLISRNITVDPRQVKRRNINQINLAELKQHPYISYKLANSIIAYRKTHGAFSSVEDLKKLVLMDDETFEKVSPYLIVK